MMKVDYTGKTVVITGAAGGIGSSMAECFASNGANVAVCDVNTKGAQQLAEAIKEKGFNAESFELNVTSMNNVKKAMDSIVETFGKIDILINNAGINVGPDKRFPIHKFDDEQWHKIIDVDLNGIYNCSKIAIPHIIKAGGGNIVNITSVVGLVPFRLQCAFTAAKAGVVNLTKAMALELAEEKIRVNAIAPGSIMMEGTAKLFYNDAKKAEAMMSHIPQHRPGNPEDIAYAALYLGSDEAGYVTGSILTVDGGWTCGFARDF